MDKKDQNGKVQVRESLFVSFMQRVAVVLSCIALILGVVLAGAFLARLINGSTDEMTLEITRPTTFMTTRVTTPAPSPTPTPYYYRELLSMGRERDLLIEDYFGPLPEVEGEILPPDHYEVHGLFVHTACNMDENIELANNSEINTFVITLKETVVMFDSKNELANDVGYVYPAYDLDAVIEQCHDNGIRVIGRIVCFKDPMLVEKYPDRGICDKDGNLLVYTDDQSSFANPYDTRNWDYYIDLALEAIDRGVDEIQFDYIRFPPGYTTTGADPYFGDPDSTPTKGEAINRFLQTARRIIQDPTGIPISADIFGIAVTSDLDGRLLGQEWKTVGLTQVDSLCPMLYPSHYALGTMMNGHVFENPDKEPYQLLYDALTIGSQYHNAIGYSVVRPYCQAFNWSRDFDYTYEVINEQIKAIQDTGLSEFILWNALGQYPEGNYGGNRG